MEVSTPTDKSQLKKKIAKSLENLNQSSQVFDDMITDYNVLYQKYISIQLMAEQNQRLSSIQLSKVQENASKMDQAELEKAYNALQEEILKLKNSKEEALVNLTKNLQSYLELKTKLENSNKKILSITSENSALKQQFILLDKRNKELNSLNQSQEKELLELRKVSKN